MRVLRLEFLLLVRGRTVPAGIALVLAAGLFGLFHGHSVIARQQAAIARSASLQDEEHRRILATVPPTANAGDQLYYLHFHTVREPSAWAAVAVGQRDVQAFNLKVTIRALHEQLYNAEFGNPLLAAFGNFDLAFVFVALAPLLVIALTFNVFSGERELGTWDLVRAQPRHPLGVLAVRFGLRALLTWLALLLLQVSATLALDLPLDGRWAAVAAGTLAHVVFWVMAAVVVSTWRRSSDLNVLVLLGLWIVCTVLGPALVNVAAAAAYPLPEALELTVVARQGFHSAWDRPQAETMAAFYQRYPEWRAVPIPADRYSNGWYYAMQQRGDDLARPAAERYRRALEERERWVATRSRLFPPALLQRMLTGVARTDLGAYLDYLDSVAAHHERLKRHFLPVIFGERTVADVDWTSAPRHQYRD